MKRWRDTTTSLAPNPLPPRSFGPGPTDHCRTNGVRTACPCGADVFDEREKHSEACRARRDLQDAVDELVDAAVHTVLLPFVVGARASEYLAIRFRRWMP